jgi:hypothetical protein
MSTTSERIKIFLVDGRELEIEHKADNGQILEFLKHVESVGSFQYLDGIDRTWLVPFHSILFVVKA